MKPVDQEVFEKGKGDCLRACIASILEVRLHEVPNFAELGPQEDMIAAFFKWCEERGYDVEYHIGPDSTYDSFHIVSGFGPRGVRHTVIAEGDKLVHDPHPSNEFISSHSEEDADNFRLSHEWVRYRITKSKDQQVVEVELDVLNTRIEAAREAVQVAERALQAIYQESRKPFRELQQLCKHPRQGFRTGRSFHNGVLYSDLYCKVCRKKLK